MFCHHACLHAWCCQRQEEGVLPWKENQGCELPFGYWEPKPGPLKEQPGLVVIEPPLQPHFTSEKCSFSLGTLLQCDTRCEQGGSSHRCQNCVFITGLFGGFKMEHNWISLSSARINLHWKSPNKHLIHSVSLCDCWSLLTNPVF